MKLIWTEKDYERFKKVFTKFEHMPEDEKILVERVTDNPSYQGKTRCDKKSTLWPSFTLTVDDLKLTCDVDVVIKELKKPDPDPIKAAMVHINKKPNRIIRHILQDHTVEELYDMLYEDKLCDKD